MLIFRIFRAKIFGKREWVWPPIEERARMVNGALEISSQEGRGTKITLVVPLGVKEV